MGDACEAEPDRAPRTVRANLSDRRSTTVSSPTRTSDKSALLRLMLAPVKSVQFPYQTEGDALISSPYLRPSSPEGFIDIISSHDSL